eukprot:TRINITY_DN7815_c0_g1_i2.p1 TRINITY_DN7815_c0_g1~~TRINITY_DN7815_c0_g1_i2.p1  ORF type:complete len:348 (+),score=46.23 TRINITY_DN7815_c0_g1_i2:106-1149(+)
MSDAPGTSMLLLQSLLFCILSTAPAARFETSSDYKDWTWHKCPYDDGMVPVEPASDEDKEIIYQLLSVSTPEDLNIISQTKMKERADNNIETQHYTNIKIKSMWKITPDERVLEAYAELLQKEERDPAIPFVLRTAPQHEKVTKQLRSLGKLSEREQLLLHGADKFSLINITCNGFRAPDHVGGFSTGLYFADQIEKSDQYSSDEQYSSDDPLRGVLVARINMGRTVQVQREIPCTNDHAERKKYKIFHWADPVGGEQDEITWSRKNKESGESTGNFSGEPPYHPWDSVQVVATRYNKTFSSAWAKTCNYSNLSNTLPWRFYEYVVKPSVLRVLPEYLVSYERTPSA